MIHRGAVKTRLKIWMYDVKLMAGWWWLAAPAAVTFAVVILVMVFPRPEARILANTASIYESLLPVVAAIGAAPLFVPERSGRVSEIRLTMPENRWALFFRRLTIAGAFYGVVWGLTYVLIDRFFTPLQLKPMLAVSMPGSLALVGMAVLGGVGGRPLPAYMIPMGYWVGHYTVFPGTTGFTLFPWLLQSRLPEETILALPVQAAAAQWIHGIMGLVLLAAALVLVMRGRAGGGA